MSQAPSPEVYERGRGMDAHNQAMRQIRARDDTSHDPREPTRVWLDEDNTPSGLHDSLTIILNTGGCRWARAGGCTMCGYVAESVDGGSVSHDELVAQLAVALEHERKHKDSPADMVKIYTSGSFLDEREIGPKSRRHIAETFADRERLVVESLPDFVEPERLQPFTDRGITTDVAVGLETATDRIRHECVNKYIEYSDFVDASRAAAAAGAGVKAYLLLKPPFLTEDEAIQDMIRSIRQCGDHAHTVSMNPCNVQRYTMVEQLYRRDGYRPPWLWSVTEVLAETADVDAIVVSDPVGGGEARGPHNCGECDDRVMAAIEDFKRRQDPAVFDEVECECRKTWEAVRSRERGYNLPLLD